MRSHLTRIYRATQKCQRGLWSRNSVCLSFHRFISPSVTRVLCDTRGYPNATWPISSYMFSYLLTLICRSGTSIDITLNLNLTSQNIYTLMYGLRFSAAPLYTICRVKSYLALSILTCSLNMSFLARLVSDNSRRLEKIDSGSVLPSHHKKIFLQGSEFLSIATYASGLTFIAPLTSEI